MSDQLVEAVERFSDAVDRLKTEQAKDMREIVQRIAALETLPGSIDRLREEFRDFQRELRDADREREKHPKKQPDSGSHTSVRVAKINTMPLMITAISSAAIAVISLAIQLIRGG
jgi:RecB family exonuclease